MLLTGRVWRSVIGGGSRVGECLWHRWVVAAPRVPREPAARPDTKQGASSPANDALTKYCGRIALAVKSGQTDAALKMLDEMLESKEASPNLRIFNNLISGLAQEGRANRAFKLFNEVRWSA